MASNLEKFVSELVTKRQVSPEDRSRYLRIADDKVYIQVGEDYVPLLPHAKRLSHAAFQRAVANAPHWHQNAPTCTNRPASYTLDIEAGPKKQGKRNTCVAFACLAGIQYVLRRDHALSVDLSEEYANWLFMAMERAESICDEFIETKDAIENLGKCGVCLEEQQPYLTAHQLQILYDCALSPSETTRGSAIYGIHQSSLIAGPGMDGPCIGNPDYLECLILKKEAIVVTVGLAIGKEDPVPGDHIYDVVKDEFGIPEVPSGSHAMLLIGYNRSGPVPYFIFRNSWGDNAHGGNIYLSYGYVGWYACYGAVIQSVSQNMPPPGYAEVGDYSAILAALTYARKRYRVRAGELFEIGFPKIPKSLGEGVLGLRCEIVGGSIETLGEEHSDEDLLFPQRITKRAVKRGLSHVVVRGYDIHSGMDIKMRPLVISVDVVD